jgi:hypothetical protein
MIWDLTKWKVVLVVLSVSAVLPSCEDQNSQEVNAELILKNAQEGDFRGVNIGDKPEDVRSTEDAETVYSMPDELVYRIPPNSKDSTWYEISYNFNQQGLYDINLEIYPKDERGMDALKKNFVDHYIEKYGECTMQNGYCSWRAMTENGHIVSITLTDSLPNDTRPRIKINFNETQLK